MDGFAREIWLAPGSKNKIINLVNSMMIKHFSGKIKKRTH
jgi:hypothetical protein